MGDLFLNARRFNLLAVLFFIKLFCANVSIPIYILVCSKNIAGKISIRFMYLCDRVSLGKLMTTCIKGTLFLFTGYVQEDAALDFPLARCQSLVTEEDGIEKDVLAVTGVTGNVVGSSFLKHKDVWCNPLHFKHRFLL